LSNSDKLPLFYHVQACYVNVLFGLYRSQGKIHNNVVVKDRARVYYVDQSKGTVLT